MSGAARGGAQPNLVSTYALAPAARSPSRHHSARSLRAQCVRRLLDSLDVTRRVLHAHRCRGPCEVGLTLSQAELEALIGITTCPISPEPAFDTLAMDVSLLRRHSGVGQASG